MPTGQVRAPIAGVEGLDRVGAGLAVMCRLTHPCRSTSDLDTVNRQAGHEPALLELLLASGAEASGASGVRLPTPAGPVQVDVLEVTDDELADLPEDPTDRLHVLSHAWAAATAAPMLIRARAMPELIVNVADPGPLIAMKLQSIMNRGAAKEATDLLDTIRLSLDPTAGPVSRSHLEAADSQLRQDAALHAPPGTRPFPCLQVREQDRPRRGQSVPGRRKSGVTNRSMRLAQVRWASTGAWMPPEARRSRPNTVPIAAAASTRAGFRVAAVAAV